MKNFVIHTLRISACALALAISFGARADSDAEAIQECFAAWGHHPFGKAKTPDQVLSQSVRVMGVGGHDVEDSQASATPMLILVKPSVTVMSKSVYKLLNPNGWYCLKGTVAVLGKSEFTVDCKAHLASTSGDVAVLGKNENKGGGVAVLGSIRLKTTGNCGAPKS